MSVIAAIQSFIAERITRPFLNMRIIPRQFENPGSFRSWSVENNTFVKIVFSRASIVIFLRADGVYAVKTEQAGIRSDYITYSICEQNHCALTVSESEDTILISGNTFGYGLLVQKSTGCVYFGTSAHPRFLRMSTASSKKGWTRAFIEINEHAYFTGFGEKTGFLFKQRSRLKMWNTDESKMNSTSDPLYQSCPWVMATMPEKSAGLFFDNPGYSVFTTKAGKQQSRLCYYAEHGPFVAYICAGSRPKDVVRQFCSLTGFSPLPPLWVLGHHHSRWESNESAVRITGIAKEFRKRNIPCDVIHIDIGYMDGYRCFTWNRKRFPDPKKFIASLHNAGFRAVVITDPGLKKDIAWDIYREGIGKGYFCKNRDGGVFHAPVWPGPSAFPDFTNSAVRSWWGNLFQKHTSIDIDGFWIDMNEPSTFTAKRTLPDSVLHSPDTGKQPVAHTVIHNIYGLLMAKATAEGLQKLRPGKRHFLFSRSAYTGIQRYASTWTGDNKSSWEHLRMAVPMILNMGLSGQPMTGPDLGGFWGAPTGELMARWLASAVFFPFHRNHTQDGSPAQEFWHFEKHIQKICISFVRLRYRFLPYLYCLFHEAYRSGCPVMRPLFFEFPHDRHCYDSAVADSQYMAGKYVCAAPILQKGITARQVYLPKHNTGGWINYRSHAVEAGGRTISVDAPFEILPLFVKQGAAFAIAEDINTAGEWLQKLLVITVYPGPDITGNVYVDDGETTAYQKGVYALFEISGSQDSNGVKMEIKLASGKLEAAKKIFGNMDIRIAKYHGQKQKVKKIMCNKKELKAKAVFGTGQWIYISEIPLLKKICLNVLY
ncbi:MAG: DUF5110 domain-containing protein [Spirochaetales bacterium]|nr:DUF5110 domain-containing protein [Spirochaetales bacterium]